MIQYKTSNRNNKTELCLHYWITNVPLLAKKLTALCNKHNKFDKSSTFLSLTNKLIISVGGDKGGNDLSMKFRIVNWKMESVLATVFRFQLLRRQRKIMIISRKQS